MGYNFSVVVFGIGKNLLFKSILGRCVCKPADLSNAHYFLATETISLLVFKTWTRFIAIGYTFIVVSYSNRSIVSSKAQSYVHPSLPISRI